MRKGGRAAIFLGMITRVFILSVLAAWGSLAMATEYGKVRIAAHRGESSVAPENTMASYELAWRNGDEAVETDIQLTKDGKVVICHDADTYRTSGNKKKVVIKDATLAEVQAVDVGSFKDPKWAGQVCPTYQQLLDGMPKGTMCYTEIKSGIDVVPAFIEIQKKSGKGPDQVVVISFHADALEASKKALPTYKHYLLANHKKDKKSGQYQAAPGVDEWIATAKRIGADGLDLGTSPLLDEAACKKVRDAGLELHVWTIDDPKVAKQYIDWGAQSVTTNRSHWMKEQLTAMDAGAKR